MDVDLFRLKCVHACMFVCVYMIGFDLNDLFACLHVFMLFMRDI